jgi:hypothetical protein
VGAGPSCTGGGGVGYGQGLCSPRVAPPGWVRDSELMGGGPSVQAAAGPTWPRLTGRRTYPPRPLTLRYA